ncbi:pyridoxal-dependent decarboxylase [Homoserinimonas sp. OAct 916]|uniref:pyridoxal phosphate-dependent decarboxylase family protein n=1 Tax=Homoserinimonas sp. OAct 916 TaxID=2211450 RepID=UPI000DBE5634|nr:pyridoxal-dependent decarboxylase [Homoserinimonas sp. OAct 916]
MNAASIFAKEPSEVLARLARLRAEDAPTCGGSVLSYIYDSGLREIEALAGDAMAAVQQVNGLDPTTFPSVAVMEREVLGFAFRVLHADEQTAGSVTTGGTESCLLAVKTARDVWRAAGGIGTPRIVAPITAHAAFRKAAHYFSLDFDAVAVDPSTGAVSAQALINRIGPDVAIMVLSAPSYPFAGLDPVAEVAAACEAAGVAVHVDACIGGWVLPWWTTTDGRTPSLWDFRVPGVTSLSADLHKFGYAPKGASVLLQRDLDRQRHQYFATTGWPGYPVINPTILGSKSAAPLAAAWAITQTLGEAGFQALSESCQRSTNALWRAVDAIEGLHVVGDPVGPLLAVARDTTVAPEHQVDPHHWADQLRELGWQLQPQPGLTQPDGTYLAPTTHLTITPVTEGRLDQLAEALATAADQVRGVPPIDRRQVLAEFPFGSAPIRDSETAFQVLRGAGLLGESGQTTLPDRMAPIVALLEALPSETGERLLIELFGRLFTPDR